MVVVVEPNSGRAAIARAELPRRRPVAAGQSRVAHGVVAVAVLAFVLVVVLAGAATGAELNANLPTTQTVGTTVEWTVTGDGLETEVFRLEVGLVAEP